jgi:predicted RNase H-like nuclease (RuvC/YqgF family)
MSDDLVKRLWESDEASALTNQAARRIEDLEKGFWNLHREYDNRGDRIEELEAKLTKAVEALEHLVYLQSGNPCTGIQAGKWLDQARTTLAELKGEDRG